MLSHNRRLQRKLCKIAKALRETADFEVVRDTLSNGRKGNVDFLQSDEGVANYEDVETFRRDIEEGFQTFQKKKGQTAALDALVAVLSSQLETHFPELGEGIEVPMEDVKERAPVKKFKLTGAMKSFLRKGETPISTLPRGVVSHIIGAITKQDFATNFLYPVSAKVYPEYYEAIETPMDLATVQDKLKSKQYETVQALYADLALIWNNCKDYNLEGSDIYGDAEDLQNFVDSIFAEKFEDDADAQYVSHKENTKRKRESGAEGAKVTAKSSKKHDPELTPAQMSKILTSMKNHECSLPFLEPVSEEVAPGYFDVISTPMDFKTVGKMLKTGSFATGKASFASTMRLVWNNCYAYNQPDSEIYEWAQILDDYFEQLLSGYVTDDVKPAAKKVKQETADADVDAQPVKKKSKKSDASLASGLEQIINEVSKDPRATAFLYPVDPNEAPGYFDVIEEPMDISKISSRISLYEREPIKFLGDFNLMFDNCQNYNIETSLIYKTADELRQLVQQKFVKFCEAHDIIDIDIHDSVNVQRQEDFNEMDLLPPVQLDFLKTPPPIDPSFPLLSRVEASYATYKSKNACIAETVNPQLSLTINVADRLLEQLLSDPTGNSSSEVRLKAHQIAAKNLAGSILPFTSENCIVTNFGYLDEASAKAGRCLYKEYIAPIAYTVNAKLVLTATKKVSKRSKEVERSITLDFTGFISNDRVAPVFAVALKNGVTVAHSRDPKATWTAVLNSPREILSHIGGKLRRCRAVFNRLCINPLVTPFIDKLDPNTPDGIDYYQEINSPMWLREIHRRLAEGSYTSEFEFLWDIELVFANCMLYNNPNSAISESARALQAEFEQLMCQWVINVSDRSITDRAKGPWDQWSYLRYFDSPTKMANVCRATGMKAAESALLFCSSCEDQYLPKTLGLTLNASNKDNWTCERCKVAIAAKSSMGQPLSVQGYSAEEYGRPLFARAADIGPGWFRSISHPSRTTVVCLSPLGAYVEFHPLDVEKLKKVEAPKYEALKKTRAMEFAKESKVGHRLDGASRRKLSGSVASTGIIAGAAAILDDSDTSVYKWAQILPSGESVDFDEEAMPPMGLFDIDENRGPIEGLKHAILQTEYQFAGAPDIRTSFVNELMKSKEFRKSKKISEERANDAIASERWFWELKEQAQNGAIVRKAGAQVHGPLTPEIYEHFGPLFPEDVNTEEAEALLSVWDFLAVTRSLMSETGVSLYELTRAVQQPSNPLIPSHAQIVFDEICCMLTGFLVEELKRKLGSVEPAVWHDVLWSKPLNILTWPVMANVMLIIMTQWNYYQSLGGSFNVVVYLKRPLDGDNLIRMQILSLVVVHPFFAALVDFEKDCGSSSFNPAVVQRKCAEGVRSDLSGYHSIRDFVADIERLWLNIYANYAFDTVESSAARVFENWFSSLLQKLNIPYTKRAAANDSSSAESTHPSTWTDAQYLKLQRLGIGRNAVLKSYSTFSSATGFTTFYGSLRSDKASGSTSFIGDEMTPAAFNELQKNPASLGTLSAILEDHLRCTATINQIESVFLSLSSSNPDFWTKNERIDVLRTLVEFSAVSSQFKELSFNVKPAPSTVPKFTTALHAKGSFPVASQSKSARAAARDLSDVPTHPRHFVEVLEDYVKVPDKAGVTLCAYSGADKFGGKDAWVYVPKFLLRSPTGEKLPHYDENGPRPVAMKNAVLKVAAARELAEDERRVQPDTEIMQLSYLNADTNVEPIAHIKFNVPLETSCLGHDRHDSEYWLLFAQDYETLLPLSRSAVAPDDQPVLTDPAILVRLTSGWWGRHTGADIGVLLSSFSSTIQCEQDLRARIIDRLYQAHKCINSGPHAIKRIHSEWFSNQRKVEKWLSANENLFESEGSEEDLMALTELFFARSIENRVSTLTALLTKNECPDINEPPPANGTRLERDVLRKKRLRDLIFEDFMDLHHAKGWVRTDTFSQIRALYSTTTASRLLADPTMFNLYNTMMKKCPMRKADVAVPLESGEFIDEDEYEPVEEARKSTITPTGFRVKPVEQLDLETGEVLRRYPSGREAASQMKASQGGISQCCSGIKKEAYNFRWRNYEGPAIDFDEDNFLPGRKTIDELLEIRFKKPGDGKNKATGEIDVHEAAEARATRRATSTKVQTFKCGQYTQYNHQKDLNQKNFKSSLVPVDYRLVKLKAELINILLLLPRHLVDFQTEIDNIALQEANAEPESKNSTKRTLRRIFIAKFQDRIGSAHDTFIEIVQNANLPQELLDCVIFFESSLNPAALVGYQRSYLPTVAHCAASVATRLFALDRAIRYEDIHTMNITGSGKYKPRIQYAPRCLFSSTCSKPLGHGGRCNTSFEGCFSRFQDLSDDTLELRSALSAPVYTVPFALTGAPAVPVTYVNQARDSSGRFGGVLPQFQSRRTPEELAEENAKRAAMDFATNEDIEIENVTPYVPKAHELKDTIWV